MRTSVAATSKNPQTATAPWWAELRDEANQPVDPITWAPWDILSREAQFGITHEGDWLVHVPSLAMVTWPDHRRFRQEALTRYIAGLRRLKASGADELEHRRAARAIRDVRRTLGILRALDVLRAIVPNRLTIEAALATPPRHRGWYHAQIAPSVRQVVTET